VQPNGVAVPNGAVGIQVAPQRQGLLPEQVPAAPQTQFAPRVQGVPQTQALVPVVPQQVQQPLQAAPQVPAAPIPTPQRGAYTYGFVDNATKPPPGTLGKTYMRPTRMIAWDKPPRVGMLDVEVLDSVRVGLAKDVKIKVTARDMYNNFKPLEGFLGEDNVWHFESEPLLPTVPQIYDVTFKLIRERTEYERRYGRLFEKLVEDDLGTLGVRRIRLIPGRIVDLVYY
jgi:hypothetical protein